MKKLISLTLTLGLVLGLTACGSTASSGGTSSSKVESSAAADTSRADSSKADSSKAGTSSTEVTVTPEAGKTRPGEKWIESGLKGVYEGMGDIRLEDDFAAYVNREWAKTAKINEGESDVSSRTEQTDRVNEAKLKVISGEKKDDEKLTSLQNLYHLLLDWDARNENTYQGLKTFSDDVMGISSIAELSAFFSDPERNILGNPMLMDLVMGNIEDALSNILVIQSPIINAQLPSEYEAAKEGEWTGSLEGFHTKAVFMLKKLCYTESEAEKLLGNDIAFETALLPALMKAGESVTGGNILTSGRVYTTDEIRQEIKNIPLCEIYEGLGYDLKGSVRVLLMDTIKAYDELYTEEHLEELKAWVLIYSILQFADYCDREIYELSMKLAAAQTGAQTLPKDEVYALKSVTTLLPAVVDEVYASYCFDKEIKPQVTELTKMMVEAYREMLREEDWLSEETKAAAIEKLDNIKLNVCYPDKLPEIGEVGIKSAEEGSTLFDAVKASKRYALRRKNNVLERKNDGTYWSDMNNYSELGAGYLASENSINIHAAICGGDYYDPDWPLEKKLGGLCYVVGHELSHAFDSDGATYDKDGNYKNWWVKEDWEEFQRRIDKLVEFYSKFVPAPQISDEPYGVEGANRVKGEAISDIASAKCLLSIAKKQESFDYKMFFEQIATIQKEQRYEEVEKQYIATNAHPIEYSRCNISVQNYDEFLETYGIKEGDGMYLAPEDRIAIW